MEDLCKRFPHVGEHILAYLDPTSVRTFKKTSKDASKFVESSRLFWISMIQKRFARLVVNRNFVDYEKRYEEHIDVPKTWKKFVVKTPIKMLRKMTAAYETFSNLNRKYAFSYTQLDNSLSPLHIAAATGDSELSTYIVGKNRGPVPTYYNGVTPFHLAARMGHLEVYKVLLENFEDNNPGDKFGETPLHLAADEGHLEMCIFLFDKVVEKNPRTNGNGDIPLRRAYKGNEMPVFLYMFENIEEKNPVTNTKTGNTLLHDAVHKEDLETCALIINNASITNPGNKKQLTPLHHAAISGYFEVFKLIFEKTVDKNPMDHDGKTPLDHAKTYNPFDDEVRREGKARILSRFK